ncbi:MAG TPA: formate dehydrogenase accessory sulfurtransferase FdhD [Anaerolineaceae bacterium]|nr:formate dehydrogenase accessory sulfurtransferase FdhD [Anaerolineaceae bacterium]
MNTGSKAITYRQFRANVWDNVETGVIVEQDVSLTVNGNVWLTFMCTPTDLESLAVGFLYNEKIIDSCEDIASVRVCPTFDNVDVWLQKTVGQPVMWRRTTGCTGGMTSTIPDPSEPANRPGDGITLSSRDIFQLLDKLFDSQELYRQVGGVHTSVLSDGRQVITSAEDIGRHNTLDKIAGRCLLDHITVQKCLLITTGRISSEMMQKAARMGASVLISRTSPSSMAIDIARREGITLVGYVHRDRFNVYTCPDRLV